MDWNKFWNRFWWFCVGMNGANAIISFTQSKYNEAFLYAIVAVLFVAIIKFARAGDYQQEVIERQWKLIDDLYTFNEDLLEECRKRGAIVTKDYEPYIPSRNRAEEN